MKLDTVIIGTVTLESVIRVIIIFLVCFTVIKILRAIATKMLVKTKLNNALQGFALSVLKVALWILATIIIADTLGISTASLVAALSVVGLALSLSVQNVMSNLFSGITLLFTHPFEVGNFVELGGKSGTVKTIGMFYTVIETADKVTVSIPNGDVTSSSIQNYNTSEQRRVDMEFRASYGNAFETVKDAILQATLIDSRILVDPEPFVAIKTYGENAVIYSVKVWCASTDYWSVYYTLNENVWKSFSKNGVEMTYNHLNVHISGNGDLTKQGSEPER